MASKNTDTEIKPRVSSADKGRSRSGGMFSTLQASKRHPENTAAADRRESLTQHSQPKGVIGNMWDSWTKGTGAK